MEVGTAVFLWSDIHILTNEPVVMEKKDTSIP